MQNVLSFLFDVIEEGLSHSISCEVDYILATSCTLPLGNFIGVLGVDLSMVEIASYLLKDKNDSFGFIMDKKDSLICY